jgi:hypothetical protein
VSDSGLQPERTTLSWQRTGLSAAVAAALLLRAGFVLAGGCAAVVMLVAWLTARHPGASRPRLLLVASAVFATTALAALRLLWAVE